MTGPKLILVPEIGAAVVVGTIAGVPALAVVVVGAPGVGFVAVGFGAVGAVDLVAVEAVVVVDRIRIEGGAVAFSGCLSGGSQSVIRPSVLRRVSQYRRSGRSEQIVDPDLQPRSPGTPRLSARRAMWRTLRPHWPGSDSSRTPRRLAGQMHRPLVRPPQAGDGRVPSSACTLSLHPCGWAGADAALMSCGPWPAAMPRTPHSGYGTGCSWHR